MANQETALSRLVQFSARFLPALREPGQVIGAGPTAGLAAAGAPSNAGYIASPWYDNLFFIFAVACAGARRWVVVHGAGRSGVRFSRSRKQSHGVVSRPLHHGAFGGCSLSQRRLPAFSAALYGGAVSALSGDGVFEHGTCRRLGGGDLLGCLSLRHVNLWSRADLRFPRRQRSAFRPQARRNV